MCYTEYTDEDTDGNGYPQHEFTPEISYYQTPNMGVSNQRCKAMSSPIEPDAVLELDIQEIPTSFTLYHNYPNPFNGETIISYAIPKDGFVNISIFNVAGQFITSLVNDYQLRGEKKVFWDTKDAIGNYVPSGVYYYVVSNGTYKEARTMTLLK